MTRIKKFRRVGGSEILDNLPPGESMAMGYLTETFISESEILGVLMDESLKATSDEMRALIDRIGSRLGVS